MVELLKFEDFDQMYSIMEQSFPYDEYRGYEGQKQLFENPEYKVFIHRNEETKEIDGFLSVWEFDDILFFEHFAVSSKVRNGAFMKEMDFVIIHIHILSHQLLREENRFLFVL